MSKSAPLVSPRTGFVVAMRATIVTAKGEPASEWLIVSRWGAAGEHLSIGRTKVAAPPGKPAPIQLAPKQTSLASMLRLPSAPDGAPTFLFAQRLPASMSLAGDFSPAEGYVRLHGRGTGLRLMLEGRCVGRAILSAWRVEATREPWIGEFIEHCG
ncbi:MAG TPA: hypothetical protein VMU81_02430 [Acetobacteraceae bacterium]|nr:hypothetical protein [Acetobacteraceae bacterium]